MKRTPEQTTRARELRRNQTNAERALWARLRNRQVEGAKFKRQWPIGPFIVDFVNLERRLVIEIDGGHHGQSEDRDRDQQRTAWLEGNGYRVLRFWNNDVLLNTDGVMEAIRQTLTPSPQPSPLKGRGSIS